MAEMRNRVIMSLETDPADIATANSQIATVESANRAMISNLRQGVQLGIFVFQAMGLMIDQTLTLLIEATLLSIEVALAISATGFGFIQGIQVATIISMLILVVQIKQKRTEAAQRTQGLVSGLRMAGFRG